MYTEPVLSPLIVCETKRSPFVLTLTQGCTALMLYGVDAVVMVTVAISQKDLWRKEGNEQPPAALYMYVQQYVHVCTAICTCMYCNMYMYVLQYVHVCTAICTYMDMHKQCDMGQLVIKCHKTSLYMTLLIHRALCNIQACFLQGDKAR